MNHISQNKKNKKDMLDTIGVSSEDELFNIIPENLRAGKIEIDGGLDESRLLKTFKESAAKNKSLISFCGGGIYDHYVPALVGEIIGRNEFRTAYTPYQAEASQGTLQAFFEYQSMICALTAMDTANSSLYDGASAAAEAAELALRVSGKKKILISSLLNPDYIRTVKTYLKNSKAEIQMLDYSENGDIKKETIEAAVDADTAAVIIQTPNYLGITEDMSSLSSAVKNAGALFIAVVNPISLGFFKAPGEYGADIAVGEGQSLGCGQSFGGATFGFMTVKKALEWKMPGRIVGQTVDKDGKRGFVLTLQSREQHIRREKATSNICTNAALNALAGCVYLAGWGSEGLKELARTNMRKAKYAFDKIVQTEGFRAKFENAVFFNEFVIETDKNIKKINKVLLKNGFLPPLDLSGFSKKLKNCLMFCITERRTKEEIDKLSDLLAGI